MDMKKKLSRLAKSSAVEPSAADVPIGASVESRGDTIKSRLSVLARREAKPRRRAKGAPHGLAGSVRSTAWGDVHVVAQAFAPEHVQGIASLKRGLVATGELV